MFADGTARAVVLSSGGVQKVAFGGTASFTVVGNVGEEFVFSGATASDTSVQAGGSAMVSSGGTTTGARLSGGFALVSSKPAAAPNATTVLAGGEQDVFGAASATVVSNGGLEVIEFAASASGAIVRNGGFQNVFGSAGGTVVSSGGFQYVYGGTASGTVLSGGSAHVASDVDVLGASIDGGTFEIVSGGADDSGVVGFTGPGTLKIDAGTPAVVVSGFHYGDSVDFAAIAPASSTVAPSGGNTVIDGVTFIGSFATAGPRALTLTQDAGSGTLVGIACFAAGTRIATETARLRYPVERLAVGEAGDHAHRGVRRRGAGDLDRPPPAGLPPASAATERVRVGAGSRARVRLPPAVSRFVAVAGSRRLHR